MPMNKKVKAKAIQLTEDNALQLIFNGYNGNMVKKAVDRALNNSKVNDVQPSSQLTENVLSKESASN